MKKSIIALIIAAVIIAGLFLYTDTSREISSDMETVADNLDAPWSLDFLPDDRIIFTERDGAVKVIENKEVKTVGNIDVYQQSESGLLGVAVDSEFEDNNYVYFYYTTENDNRIVRYTLKESLEDETLILEGIPSARFHDGGRIKFHNGYLFAATGDATNPSSSQDTDSLAGKILRLNKDGSIPEDNPFGNYVYSYGHRNVQGLAWSEDSMYASEHGPTRNDEVNEIIKGENYGWPEVQCDSHNDYKEPISCYDDFTLAPAGIAYYDDRLYVTGLRGTQLREIDLNTGNEEIIIDNLGRLRDVVYKEGFLYMLTNNRDGRGVPRDGDDRIVRIRIS